MTRTAKFWIFGVWAFFSLIAVLMVGYFVFQHPNVPVMHGYLALPSVDSVAKAVGDLGVPKADLSLFRKNVKLIESLEQNADPKAFDDLKQKLTDIAKSIEQATKHEESLWGDVNHKSADLVTVSKSLVEEAAAIRTKLNSLQDEGVQWKASLISALLSSLLWSAFFVVALFNLPNLTGMLLFAVRFVRGVKVPGFEISFTEKSAERNQELHIWFSDAFNELRSQAKKPLRLFVEQQGIMQVFRSTVDKILKEVREARIEQSSLVTGGEGSAPPISTVTNEKVRCTLHVPDVVFEDYMCQLLDYYPRGTSDGRAGRAWPMCYGMIGRVWRSEKSELRSLGAPGPDVNINAVLIDDYAMTRDQAEQLAGGDRCSFLCLLLRDNNGDPVGVLYMDSVDEKVFGEHRSNSHVAVRERDGNFERLLSHCKLLAEKLSVYREKIYGKAPLIEVMDTQ